MQTIDNNLLQNKKHIHFIGIGGSGMYPLAQILHSEGYYLTGSDNNPTDTLTAVKNMGIPVYLGHSAENIKGADLIVYTAAIMKDNPELNAALSSGITTVERSILLGLITQRYDNAICVCGTHGKTTTSSMITQILMTAQMDPTAVIGGKLPAIGGSGRAGKSDLMVCEACEFVDTFLKLSPDIAVILNIDADHLDYFKTLENIIHSFHRFAEMTTKTIIVNGDDENSLKALVGIDKEIITFGLQSHNDYTASNIKTATCTQKHTKTTEYDLLYKGTMLAHIVLHIPGMHNVYNSLAACAATRTVGAPLEAIRDGLNEFAGAGRRFEVLGMVNGVTIADDYAHHPAEIKVTLEAAKTLGYRKIWAVFQPFTYSRTAMLLDDFADVLSIADHVVLSEIMGSREVNTYNIYAKDLCEKIDGCVWFETFDQIDEYVSSHAQPGDLVITLGCGDVYKVAKMLLAH